MNAKMQDGAAEAAPPVPDSGFVGSGGGAGAGGAAIPGTGGTITGAGGTPGFFCGDGTRLSPEACDRDDLGGFDCTDLGYDAGSLGCRDDCRFDVSGCYRLYGPVCIDVPPDAVDGCTDQLCNCVTEADFECDSDCWDSVRCYRENCGDGPISGCPECPEPSEEATVVLYCLQNEPPCNRCGDGVRDAWEACDGDDVNGLTCADVGRRSGELRCDGCYLDTSGCAAVLCGDGYVGPGEACEGNDLQGQDCTSFGYVSGDLRCDRATCRFDFSGCEACGNGFLEPGEACDGSSLGGQSCRRRGFAGGVLQCTSVCEIDDAACARCGNGTIEPGENCDGAEFGGATCESLGYAAGTLACSSGTCLLDVSGCPGAAPTCSDGIAQAGEECDGSDLLGLDCATLGFGSGELRCAPNCRLDTSQCQSAEPDPCERCREVRCGSAIEACAAEPGCRLVLNCAAGCQGPPDPFCLEECAWAPSPQDIEKVLERAGAVLSCVSVVCSDECGGALR